MSAFALDALNVAVKVAGASKAMLYLLHVIDNPYDELYMTSITQADPVLLAAYKDEPVRRAQIMSAALEHAEVMLKQFAHESVRDLPKMRYLVASGDPFEKIVDTAEDQLIDLIVLATHGRTGVKRLLIGSVAEKVVRHAPCPVLTVKRRAAVAELERQSSNVVPAA
jgi:nucleotide-binding universal stress UspA family protein